VEDERKRPAKHPLRDSGGGEKTLLGHPTKLAAGFPRFGPVPRDRGDGLAVGIHILRGRGFGGTAATHLQQNYGGEEKKRTKTNHVPS
jgi:hypothetical protein